MADQIRRRSDDWHKSIVRELRDVLHNNLSAIVADFVPNRIERTFFPLAVSDKVGICVFGKTLAMIRHFGSCNTIRTTFYVNGVKNGVQRAWYINGSLRFKRVYKDGIRVWDPQ